MSGVGETRSLHSSNSKDSSGPPVSENVESKGRLYILFLSYSLFCAILEKSVLCTVHICNLQGDEEGGQRSYVRSDLLWRRCTHESRLETFIMKGGAVQLGPRIGPILIRVNKNNIINFNISTLFLFILKTDTRQIRMFLRINILDFFDILVQNWRILTFFKKRNQDKGVDQGAVIFTFFHILRYNHPSLTP